MPMLNACRMRPCTMKRHPCILHSSFCLLVAVFIVMGAPAVSGAARSEEDDLQRFTSWLISNGAEGFGGADSAVEVVLLGDSPPSLGLSGPAPRRDIGGVARRDITAGQPIFALPKNLIISSEGLRAEGQVPYAEEDEENLWYPYTLLATWLLRERAKGEASFWAPYITILPKVLHLPIFLEEELLREFQSEQLLNDTQGTLGILEKEYRKVDPSQMAGASFADFKWAMGIQLSRCFAPTPAKGVPRAAHTAILLVPLGDLLDHEEFYQATWGYTGDKFVFTAVSSVQSGMPVYTSYGIKSNLDYLEAYGFLPDSNSHDSVRLFHSVHDVVWAYTTQFARTEFSDVDVQWAEYVAAEAHRKIALLPTKMLEEQLLHRGPEWNYVEGSGFAAWPEGRVEPRLVAAIAAIFQYESLREEPDYEAIGEMSVQYGRNEGNVSCKDLQAHNESLAGGIHMAVAVIHGRVEEMLRFGATTFEEDEAQLLACPGASDPAVYEDGTCPKWWATHPREMELAVKFRLSRKALLLGVASRLLETCGSAEESPDGDAEDGEAYEAEDSEDDSGEEGDFWDEEAKDEL